MSLTQKEASVIVDALEGIDYTKPLDPQLLLNYRGKGNLTAQSRLYYPVMDAFVMDELAKKWGFDADERYAFVVKLTQLSENEASAILDKVTDFYNTRPHTDMADGLVKSGLLANRTIENRTSPVDWSKAIKV